MVILALPVIVRRCFEDKKKTLLGGSVYQFVESGEPGRVFSSTGPPIVPGSPSSQLVGAVAHLTAQVEGPDPLVRCVAIPARVAGVNDVRRDGLAIWAFSQKDDVPADRSASPRGGHDKSTSGIDPNTPAVECSIRDRHITVSTHDHPSVHRHLRPRRVRRVLRVGLPGARAERNRTGDDRRQAQGACRRIEARRPLVDAERRGVAGRQADDLRRCAAAGIPAGHDDTPADLEGLGQIPTGLGDSLDEHWRDPGRRSRREAPAVPARRRQERTSRANGISDGRARPDHFANELAAIRTAAGPAYLLAGRDDTAGLTDQLGRRLAYGVVMRGRA